MLLGLGLFASLQAWIILTFDGTCDAGDSVMHYLFAAHAPSHPENLLDLWAKPFFTLLATPFAQMGFAGIKAMQCLLSLLTAWMAYRYAALAGWRLAWLAPLFVLAAPGYFLAQFSGLTEPLFGCILMAGALLTRLYRYWAAALLLSLLPFVRMEGFFILAVYGLAFLRQRAWWPTLGLGAGLVVYSLVGAICLNGDLLWVFHHNPYQVEASNYGTGSWTHYFQQYIFVAGVPLYGLTALGLLAQALHLPLPALAGLRARLPAPANWFWAVLLPFAVYFLLHVFFWATGIGHSLGMLRVMVAVVPLGGLLACYALQTLMGLVPAAGRAYRLDLVLAGLVAAYVTAFPLLPNPASLHLPRDLQPSGDQALVRDAADWLAAQDSLAGQDRLMYGSHPCIGLYAGRDPFDTTAFRRLYYLTQPVPSGSIMIWDSWFSVIEHDVPATYWDLYPGDYALIWQRDTVVAKARSELRVYLRR